MCRRTLEPGLAFALGTGAVDIVIALAPQRDEPGNQFRRVLAIGIEDHRGALLDQVQAGGQSRFLAEVARQPHQRDACIGGGEFLQHRPGAVAAAVIDVQHAAIDPIDAQGVEDVEDPPVQHGQRVGLVEGGNDDGQAVMAHAAHASGWHRSLRARPLERADVHRRIYMSAPAADAAAIGRHYCSWRRCASPPIWRICRWIACVRRCTYGPGRVTL